jgi:hypothetical protein
MPASCAAASPRAAATYTSTIWRQVRGASASQARAVPPSTYSIAT